MTKTAKEIITSCIEYEPCSLKGCEEKCHSSKIDQALKELEAIIEATYDNLPSLDKLTVGNEVSDGYDRGVEAFRQAMIKATLKEHKEQTDE